MLKITSPNFEEIDGKSRLSNYTFSGNLGRKFVTVENTGSTIDSVDFYLSMTGGTGCFKLFPAGATLSSLVIAPGQFISLSVDYDYSWGGATSAQLFSTSDIYSSDGSSVVLGPTASVTFDISNNIVQTRRELGSLFTQTEDGDYQVDQAANKITEDETSFGLVRTNPKISGNVKLTVDSDGEIWLNSIDASKTLTDDRFKKYRLSINSPYTIDLFKFFDNGGTPPEVVFGLYEMDSQYTSTKRQLSQQYDRFYQYGVTELKSKYYEEDFSFFAPLYLKKEIPDYFVIFRTDGAINKFTYELPFDQWPSEVTSQILSNSKIVKVFDMSSSSNVGAYLRNLVNHPSRTETDLTVSYQRSGYTTYNGIAYTKGTFIQAGELLYDYFNQENPLISAEEFVTLGFERNKVISSHLINMEFLFSDSTADMYSVNRYFGLYVNAVDLAKFSISAGGLQAFSGSVGQTPLPRRGVDGNKLSQKPFVQKNDDGIRVYLETETLERSVYKDPLKVFSSTVISTSYDSNTLFLTLPGNFTPRISDGDQFNITAGGLTAVAGATGSYYDGENTVVFLDKTTYVSNTPFSLLVTYSPLSCNFYTENKYRNYLTDLFSNRFIENAPRFFYLEDNQGNLHSVAKTEIKSYHVDPFTLEDVIEVKLKDTQLDMSRLGGFSQLLTQSDATSLSTKGNAGIEVELTDFLNGGDFFEISWVPGPTSSGYPLRWRAVANPSSLNPGEVWPDYTLTSDVDGDFYMSQFHPGNSTIHLETLASNIRTAFDQFPFKDFQVVAKGTKLYFKSTQDGAISDSAIFKYNLQSPSVKVMGIEMTSNVGIVSFMGGSDRKNTRAKVPKSVAQGMLKTEYISTKGMFSPLKVHTVMGYEIIFAPYLDEPVYDNDGNLVDFNGVEEYAVVASESEAQPLQLTSDSKITTYGVFRPTFGILSVLPLRDFDTDYFYSDYTKSYTPELVEYFGRYASPTTIIGVTGTTYEFDSSFSFDSYPMNVPYLSLSPGGVDTPVLHNSDSQFIFYAQGTTATHIAGPTGNSYYPNVGDTVLFMPFDKNMYFSDLELAKFKGFLSLSSVVSSQDEENFKTLENLWDPARFTFQLLNSEYDRLSENTLKQLVLKSRVVPYISKWVSPQGKDIRDNPYRFNYHRSFGNMSFTPSDSMLTPDPRFHTHEWPYLDAVPDSFQVEKFPEYAFSYMFDPLSNKYDFSSLKRDWFSEYFSTGFPTEMYMDTNGDFVPVKIDPSEKYAFFNYQTYNDSTVSLFRGYRFAIKEIDSNGAPIDLSTKYDNYRFSAIIETEEDDSFNFQEPVKFKLIVNEKWKFILLKITVYTSSYRFSEGRLKYVDLYTLYNSDEKATYEYSPLSVASPFTYREAVPVDRKLTTPINFSSYSVSPELTYSYSYYDTVVLPVDTYIEDMGEEIVTQANGDFNRLVSTYDSGSFYRALVTLPAPLGVFSKTVVQLSSTLAYTSLAGFYAPVITTLPNVFYSWQNFTTYHLGGGNFSFSGMRERISFSEILRVITGTSDKSTMTYEIYREDGSSLNTANFRISPISPEPLTRVYDYFPIVDTDKPQEFYNEPVIGAALSQQKDLQTLYRYQGNFSPKFRDVLKFWLREDEDFTFTTSRDFLLNNTHVGTELADFSLLRNQYYFKVSDSEILRLSPSSAYKPVYPLIDEISIEKKNEFAWNSSWDQNYYRKYTSVKNFTELKGTEEMTESKSLLGSKVMKVPGQFDLFQFELTQARGLNEGTADRLNEYTDSEIAYFEDGSSAYLQVNVYNRLLREMMGTTGDSRAKTEFIKTMNAVSGSFDPSLIDDYVSLYLKNNILDLYEISDVKLYVLETGNSANGAIATLNEQPTVPSANSTTSQVTPSPRPLIEYTFDGTNYFSLSESELFKRNYLQRKDTRVTNLGNLIFRIKYPLDSRYYTSLSMGVTVKRI